MGEDASQLPYRELAARADSLLARAGEDDLRLAWLLDGVEPPVRRDLLASDLLNALQVFLYHFRTWPGPLALERLMLEPASALRRGVTLEENDMGELVFCTEGESPVILVYTEEPQPARFEGRDAYMRGRAFLDGISL